MKFQLKALVAALALAAVAVPAQAAIDKNASGNGSFILTVLDTVAHVSAAFDLGKNYLDFNQVAAAGAVSNVTASGTSFSWDLAGNADYSTAWTSFLAAANLANVTYAISGGDSAGTGAGTRGYITTYAGPGATSTTNLLTALGNFDLYTNSLNVVPGSNVNLVDNGSAFQSPEVLYYGSGKNYNTGVTAVGAIGTSLGVAQSVSAAANLSNVTTTVFGNGAQFTLASNGALSYTTNAVVTPPVPEADTWAMMLLGLGFMGFVARRRKA